MEKLSGKNYTNWQIIMTSLLKSQGLWEYCTTEIKSDDEETMKKNEEAKHLMYVSMDASQITATGTCYTAHALWQKIKENNEGAESTLRSTALAEFLGFKYNRGETIMNFCGRFELALGRLDTTGHVTDEQTKLWVFRNQVPNELKQFVTTWTMAEKDGKVTDLISQIKLHYHMNRMEFNEESIALYSNDDGEDDHQDNSDRNGDSSQQKDCDNPVDSDNIDKGEDSDDSDAGGNEYPNTTICHYCKKKGHKWRECRKLEAEIQRKKRPANNQRDQKPELSAFMAGLARSPNH